MEEKTFVGYGYGNFQNERNVLQPYCSVFVLEDFNGTQNADYRFGGQKAGKYRCVGPEVWKDIPLGSRVQCYFDSKNRISYMVAVDKK